MKDRPLTFAIVLSLVFHLAVLAVVGATAASRLTSPMKAEQVQRMMRIELVRDPMEQPKPEPSRVAPKPPRVERVELPPRQPGLIAPAFNTPPRTAAPTPTNTNIRATAPRNPERTNSGSTKQPGDPGGKLNIGSTSTGGDLGGNWGGGKTPVGWVPGGDSGRGAGSGTGRGVGTPDPPPHADPGPGTRPAPAQAPSEPAPVVHKVTVTICRASGMLAGKHCDSTSSKSFVQGTQPGSTCTSCRAPEPAHQSVVAKSTNPVLSRDAEVSTRGLEEGLDLTVKVGYTVNADGSVSGVSVIKSSGSSQTDRAVTAAASKLRYKPATQNGAACSVKMTRTYRIRT